MHIQEITSSKPGAVLRVIVAPQLLLGEFSPESCCRPGRGERHHAVCAESCERKTLSVLVDPGVALPKKMLPFRPSKEKGNRLC